MRGIFRRVSSSDACDMLVAWLVRTGCCGVVPGTRKICPGRVRRRDEIAPPLGYAVVDLETTGTSVESDEIVSPMAVVRLDAEGAELDRFASLVRPGGPIPPGRRRRSTGSTTHRSRGAPFFAELERELLGLLDGAVFVAHNADFDLPLLMHAFARAGIRYRPPGVACTLDGFRLLEPGRAKPPARVAVRASWRPARPRARCARRRARHGGAVAAPAHARGDRARDGGARPVLHTCALRSRGDTRPVSEPQVRRVFALARRAGLVGAGRNGRPRRGRRARRACERCPQTSRP